MSPVTIDTSVWINAFRFSEVGSRESFLFLGKVKQNQEMIFSPTLLLPEIAAVLVRADEKKESIQNVIEKLRALPNQIFIPLEEATTQVAVDLAQTCKLRGADAVFAAVSFRFGSTLITRDREQVDSAERNG